MKNMKPITLAVILASGSITVMTGSIIAPVVNLMRDGLGATASSVGFIITTHSLFLALSSPAMGHIIDRKGIKGPFAFGLIVYGLAGGSGLFLNNFWALLASRAILGIALASFFAATNTLILNIFEDTTRARITGWHSSAQSFSGIFWPMVGGALGAWSWHMPFAVYLVAIPIGFIAAVNIPKKIARPRQNKLETETSVFRIFRENPVLFIICSLMFYLSFHMYAIVIYLPQALETYGITNTFKISLFLSAIATSAGIISFFYWRFRARLSYQTIIVTAVTIDVVSFILISNTSWVPAIAAAVALFGVGLAFIVPTCLLWIGDLVPPYFRGRFSSYLLMIAFFAQFASQFLFAPVSAILGLRAVFLTGTCSSLLWLAMLIFFRKLMRSNPAK